MIRLETTAAGSVSWEQVDEDAQQLGESGGGSGRQLRRMRSIKVPRWPRAWVLSMDQYDNESVGAKSKTLAGGFPLFTAQPETHMRDAPSALA